MWYELLCILTSNFYIKLFKVDVVSSWLMTPLTILQDWYFYCMHHIVLYTYIVSSGSKIVKRLRRRKYDPLIIERTIGLVLGPSTALYRSFLKHSTPTNKAVGTIWQDLSKSPQRRQGPDPRPLWLLVGSPLVLWPELASRRAEQSHSGGCLYIFWYTVFITLQVCVMIFMASPP